MKNLVQNLVASKISIDIDGNSGDKLRMGLNAQ